MPQIGPLAYALDTTGLSPANLVTNELHSIAAINDKDYHFLVPSFAPFFSNSLALQLVHNNGTTTNLIEGSDYLLAMPFKGASEACGKPVYGAVSFLNLQLTGIIKFVSYQTIGGTWTLSLAHLTEVMANIIYNPRSTTWEQVANVPNVFPVVDHVWNLNDMVGMSEVVSGISAVANAIAEQAATQNQAHINRIDNPHQTTKAQVGLGNVLNYGMANLSIAIAGETTEGYINPLTLKGVLDHYGVNASSIPIAVAEHIASHNNPHVTTSAQVGLGNVANLPLATSAEVIAGAPVAKYLTMELFMLYLANHGGTLAIPPNNTLVGTYCDGTTKMGRYANGSGGTFTAVIQTHSPECGFVEPAHGVLLTTFCQSNTFNRMGRYADGVGGYYDQLIEANSVVCGYTPPTAYGTLISSHCDGTTKIGTYANGSGGTYDAVIATNSTECGYVAPIYNPVMTVTCAPTTLNVGAQATLNFNTTGLLPLTTYKANVMASAPGGSRVAWELFGTPLVHTFITDHLGACSFTIDFTNSGQWLSGWWTVGVDIETEFNNAVDVQVIPASINFNTNKSLTLSTSNTNVSTGHNFTLTATMTDYKINSDFNVVYHAVRLANNIDSVINTQAVTTNSFGRATSYYIADNVTNVNLGNWRYYAVVDGLASNNINMTFIA